MNIEKINIQATLKGKQIFYPTYIEQEVEEYADNPCIEALPMIFDDKEVTEHLLNQPKHSADECLVRNNVRYHLINRVKDFFLPLDNHYKIEHMLSSMIRRGYISRNPASKEYVIRLNCLSSINEALEKNPKTSVFDVCNMINNKILEVPTLQRPSSECASIIGISGMGKTQTVERLLTMYPQVIYHSRYKEKPLTRTQITWLKIDCPYDGSLKTMCKMFFNAVDDVLGNANDTYSSSFGNNRNSTASMMIYMARLACLHSIGVLVIDEIQHIIHPKNNPEEILNFLATLINTIGIPIMMIGTPKAASVLEKGLKNARRAASFGSVYWDRMNSDDEEWNLFLEVLWRYQWLGSFAELTKGLKAALYYESQGIIAIAVTLFILAQKQAIFEKKETVTIDLLHRVADSDMRFIKKLTSAIRNKKTNEIEKYEDISIDVNDIIVNTSFKLTNHERIRELTRSRLESIENKTADQKQLIIAELKAFNIFKYLSDKDYEEIATEAIRRASSNNSISDVKKVALSLTLEIDKSKEENRKKNKSIVGDEIDFEKDDLRKIYYDAKQTGRHIYEVLLEEDYIKNVIDDYKTFGVNI